MLRRQQYAYEGMELGQYIALNKVQNQRQALMNFRNKDGLVQDAIDMLDMHISKLQSGTLDMNTIMGIEGSAARVYFPQMFNNVKWKGRKPRIKCDYVNAALDIGYTILFNIMDALINCYGFDEYYGVLHRCFYMRKSLVCDLMEPLRPVIDYALRKAINLQQIKEEDFEVRDKRYMLEWKKSPQYTQIFLKAILGYRDEMFSYIQGYYRAFMKQKAALEFPVIVYKG